jgi:hypothetical protein
LSGRQKLLGGTVVAYLALVAAVATFAARLQVLRQLHAIACVVPALRGGPGNTGKKTGNHHVLFGIFATDASGISLTLEI